ncbi:DNA alkylation repair protein [Candidatus Pacearchaeota archaeon]|nr:DNA alkylation repair protein [Candidatus Pacearchaeota archaeon]
MTSQNLKNLIKELNVASDKEKAKIYQRFFKTGKGEYGEGDIFIGVTTPKMKEIAKKYSNLSLKDVKILLSNKIHEYRSCALAILVNKFNKTDSSERKNIFNIYIKNAKSNKINNWDLVDCSADKIVGAYLFDENPEILRKLAKSKNLWEKRIAIVSTFHFIKNNKHEKTIEISEILVNDKHDLIHKAVGWMLREVGKRVSQEKEEEFLERHHKTMPRTMLRYAIERFDDKKKKYYMS